MATSNSSATAYASVADAILRHDERQWGDLVSNDNTRVAAAALPTNDVMLALLKEASGMVEMACLRGLRYSSTDLGTNISGVSKQLLIGLVVELAFWKATVRRHPDRELAATSIWALQILDKLAEGEKIFSFDEAAAAGVQNSAFMQQSDWQRLNLSTTQARRYWGQRSRDFVPGP